MNIFKKNYIKLKNIKTFLIFAGPSTFIFISVIILPFLFGIFLTFTNWDGISSNYNFSGFTNYIKIFKEHDFWSSFLLTIKYVIISVILINIIAFFLAYILTQNIIGQNIFRTIFFVPNLIGGIILGLLWKLLFSNVFVFIGIQYGISLFETSWLGSPDKALWALIIGTVWQYSGYMMIIYIAGFINIPKEIIEAAKIDGATNLKQLKNIIIPLLVPSIIISLFLSIQRSFMVYEINFSLTGGEPYKSTQLISMFIYEKAFTFQEYGIGQAEAFILFAFVATVSLIKIYFSKKMEVEL